MTTRAHRSAGDAPVPLEAAAQALAEREHPAAAVDEEQRVGMLGDGVGNPQLLDAGDEDPGPQALQLDRRPNRVDADRIREVDGPAGALQVDDRIVGPVRDELAGGVAPVPANVEATARERSVCDGDLVRADAYRYTEPVGPAKRELDVRSPRGAAANRREHVIDARLRDRARLELQALRHREGRRRRHQQDEGENRRSLVRHGGATVRLAYGPAARARA